MTYALLDAAYAAGVRYLDTARSYGYAEEFLSSWLAERKIAPGEVTVGSKLSTYRTYRTGRLHIAKCPFAERM